MKQQLIMKTIWAFDSQLMKIPKKSKANYLLLKLKALAIILKKSFDVGDTILKLSTFKTCISIFRY